MLEAILLVGGQGTRLRPLTISTPKPMLPVAGFACTEHQIALARAAGVERIVLGTSYRAEVFENYFGHGENFGVELVYAVEDEPLGTGGAIRNAAAHLTCRPNDPVVVFNGDVLTGLDIAGLVQKWRDADADVALYLTCVEDPRAYGLVPTDANGRVLEFLEKPTTPEEIVTDQINAGCYVFNPRVISAIPLETVVSVERETFPQLVSNGAKIYGYLENAYWLDIGTPKALLKASTDIVLRSGPGLVMPDAQVDSTAVISGGSCIGRGSTVGAGTRIDGSIVEAGAVIGRDVVLENSFVATGAVIDDGAKIGSTFVTKEEILPIPA